MTLTERQTHMCTYTHICTHTLVEAELVVVHRLISGPSDKNPLLSHLRGLDDAGGRGCQDGSWGGGFALLLLLYEILPAGITPRQRQTLRHSTD